MSNEARFLLGRRWRAHDTVNPGDSDRSLASAARASAGRSSCPQAAISTQEVESQSG